MRVHIIQKEKLEERRVVLECNVGEIFVLLSTYIQLHVGNNELKQVLTFMSLMKCDEESFAKFKNTVPDNYYILFKTMREIMKTLNDEEFLIVRNQLIDLEKSIKK
jgi:uncharacterized Fe-S cluster-containing radical SAM superfamily protein